MAIPVGRDHGVLLAKGEGRSAPPPPSLPAAGIGRQRKVAIIGSAPTVDFAPWHDASWEIWSHAICVGRCKRVDRLFELHTPNIWRDHKKPQWPTYVEWLKRQGTPIYMQEKYPEVPASVRYPKERVLAEFRRHVGSQTDWMIALAITEGVTHLGFFGVHYDAETERYDQLLAVKYWLGFAEGRGVQLVIPEGCPLFRTPRELYGYESHSTPEKYQARLDAEKVIRRREKAGARLKTERLVPHDPLETSRLNKKLSWGDQLGTGPAPENWAQFQEA